MSDEVLVAYATRHESTRGVATAIAAALAGAGLRVRLEAVDAVGDLRAFRAAVIGCTVFAGEWMPGANAFLVAHRRQLESMPVWLFATGPAEPLPAGMTVEVPNDLVNVIERIGPRDVALFAGSLQPHHLGAGLRILARLARSSFSERRDRGAVDRWAGHIAQELGASHDAGLHDSGSHDAGSLPAGPPDARPHDAGPHDARPHGSGPPDATAREVKES